MTNQEKIKEFIETGLKGKSEDTKYTYRLALEQFARWLDGAGTDLTGYARSDVQQFIDYLVAKGKSAATINKTWNAIKKYSKWANKKECIEDIRVVKQKDYKQEAPKSLDRNERNRLIREAERTGNKRDFAIIMLFLYTGIRVRELVLLNRTDIEISDRKGQVTVRFGKGNKERTIPLNPEVRRAISKYLEDRDDCDPALFLSNRGKRISKRTVQAIIGKYGFHPHQLRHTFITGLVRAGHDFSKIQSLSGHSTADMIMRYSKPSEQDKQDAVDRLYID